MSPQLHTQIYGFHQHSFGQSVRVGGWRPTVFMQHGLQVALWMAGCVVLAFSQWWVGGRRRFSAVPMWSVLSTLCVTFLLLKSTGALVLAILGITSIFVATKMRTRIPLLILPAVACGYLVCRSNDLYSGRGLVDVTRTYVSEERAQSLEFRLDNEDLLLKKAWQQPVFGWGGWGRNRVYNEDGRDVTITDGLWIIEFGTHGLIGLVSLYALQIVGGLNVVSKLKLKVSDVGDLDFANEIGLCIICGIATIDTLPNAMVIPIFTMSLGALSSSSLSWRSR